MANYKLKSPEKETFSTIEEPIRKFSEIGNKNRQKCAKIVPEPYLLDTRKIINRVRVHTRIPTRESAKYGCYLIPTHPTILHTRYKTLVRVFRNALKDSRLCKTFQL